MINTLIIEDKNNRASCELASIIGFMFINTRIISKEEIPESLEKYSLIVNVADDDRSFNVKYVEIINSKDYPIKEQRIKLSEELFAKYKVADPMMPKEMLLNKIDEFAKAHNTFALCTCANDIPRCTPLEYIYKNKCFYVMTEGGMKFRGILQNDNASAGIYEPYDNMHNVSSLQITGKIEIIEKGSNEYTEVANFRKLTAETLKKFPIDLYMIKLTPVKYEMLCSKFKKEGYDNKQSVEL